MALHKEMKTHEFYSKSDAQTQKMSLSDAVFFEEIPKEEQSIYIEAISKEVQKG